MNQILSTQMVKEGQAPSDHFGSRGACPRKCQKRKNWFRFQFTVSIFIVLLLIGGAAFYFYRLGQKENFSNRLLANYNIYRLYSNSGQTTATEQGEEETQESASNGLFGIIEIPKIGLYYPVFSHLSEDLLKVSPCKFYGGSPKENGNICIAGHNYDNTLFFSKISSLSTNDTIFLYDEEGTQYLYLVYEKYEVSASDLSPVLNYNANEKTLTLVTCNNFNNNRIIIKAKQKKLS